MTQSFLALLLLALLGSACQPALTPVARPTPLVLVAKVTPALQPVREMMRACAEESDNTGLVLLDRPATALDGVPSALALRWGPPNPPAASASVLGQEEMVIILNPANPLTSVALTELRAIYQGRMQTWPGTDTEIQAWAYPSGDDIQQVFEAIFLDGTPIPQNSTYTAPDPAAMLKAVAASPTAVGFLPRRWKDDSVQAVRVNGLNTTQMSQPILAISQSEPTGLEKAWLLCLQARLAE